MAFDQDTVEKKPAAPPEPSHGKKPVPLQETLEQIRRDSRLGPEKYVAEVTVPFGGE